MSKEYTVSFSQMRDIYLESIATQSLLSEKKKKKDDDKLDPVGKEDEDIDNDGDEDETDDYLINRRAKRSSIIKSKKVNENFTPEFEGYYDWRSTVSEEIQAAIDELEGDKIEEKPVNNYAKGKNGKTVVTINPSINISEAVSDLGGNVLQESELSLEEVIEIATEYFYDEGLNAEGVEMVIEELGADSFSEFVIDLAENHMLTEARRSGRIEPVTKTGKDVGSLKGGAKTAAINRLRKEKQARRDAEDSSASSRPSGMSAALKAQTELARKSAVKTAKTQQTPTNTSPAKKKRGILDVIAGQILKGMDRDKQARERFSQTKAGQTLSSAGRLVSGAAKAASGVMETPGIKKAERNITAATIKGTRRAAAGARDLVAKETARRRVQNEDCDYLEEKAVSEQQQKLFGSALSVKRGQTSRDDVSKQVLEIVDSMSESQIRKFAKTKHEGIPKTVSEGLNYEDILRFMRQ
jgi:hypothetical protein